MHTSLRHGYTCDILWLGRRHIFPEHPTGASRPTGTKSGAHALKPLAAMHIQARERQTSSYPMPNVTLLKEPSTRKLSVNARRSDVWTVF